MIYCTKQIAFDAAHRIIGHTGGCQMLHGHRYVVKITFANDVLNDMSMVIDFKHIKSRFKNWIDLYWDHNTILNREDIELGQAIEKHTNQKIFYLKQNPTSEVLSQYLFQNVLPEVFYDISYYIDMCSSIEVCETPTSSSCFVKNSPMLKK